MSTTTDLSKFGQRELKELELTLRAWREHGLPSEFSDENVHPMFNMNSGCVFLTNDNYEVAMLTDDKKLEIWHTCPECGEEGFLEDMKENGSDCCFEFLGIEND
jgi:hypothetical protein